MGRGGVTERDKVTGKRTEPGAGQAACVARFEPMEPRLLLDSVVINEIHYDPDVKTEPAEFVELHNTTGAAIDISHWKISEGIEYEFPETTILPPHGYVVVAENPATILTKYGIMAYGPFVGKLENDGELLVLRDAAGAKVDEVDYKDVPTLVKLTTQQGKIFSRKRSGNCARHQRSCMRAIKRARLLALIPYVA